MSDFNLPENLPDNAPIELTARQIALKVSLDEKYPELGAMYYGALLVLRNNNNPDAVYQSSHSIRELIRRLPQIVPTLTVKKDSIDIVEKLKELITRYQDNPELAKSYEWISEISILIDQSSFSHRFRLGELFDKCDQAGLSAQEKERSAKNLHEIYTWFVNVCHHREKPSIKKVLIQINRLELILEVLFRPYFEIEPEIEKLIEIDNPSKKHLNNLKSLLIKRAFIEYWFRNLENYKWLPLLKDASFFSKPIDIITHEDGCISCPSWPQASYLLKCVDSNPDLVCEIIESVEDTENARVHQELVEIALKLPGSLLNTFAGRAKNWIRDRYHTITLLPIRLAELAAKLATDGEISTALSMTDTILDVRIDDEKYKQQEKRLGYRLPPEADAFVDDWHYERLLKTIRPAIIKVAAFDYLSLICQKLSKAIRIEHKVKGDKEATVDYTYISRPAIEDHEQNTRTDRLKDHLIDYIRDISFQIVQESGSIDDILSCLRQYRYPVFLRLELYLLTEFPELGKTHIAAMLQNDELFSRQGINHEFHRLLEKAFGNATPEIQKVYYDWIASGPNIERYKATFAENEPSPEQIESYVALWKLRQYHPIKSCLNNEQEIICTQLEEKYEIEEHPEFDPYRTSWVGPTSPLNAKELSQQTVKEVINYLKEWTPSGGHRSPSPEGLGRFFKDDVRNRAIEYSQIADTIDLKELRPVYIYYYYTGLEESLKNKTVIDWPGITKLSEFIVTNNELPEPVKSGDDFETGWRGVRNQVARLFSEGLISANTIPFNLREKVWNIIKRLCEDSDPTLEYEAEYGGSNMSPVDMSINTVRGNAVHGLFHYLIWVDENANIGISDKDKKHSIPTEAFPVLERLFDIIKEPTLTIRSVIGWYIQWLAFLDLNYIQSKLDIMIPQDTELIQYRNACFEGYFSFNHPNRFLFKNLKPFFVGAFDWSNVSETEESIPRPKQNYVTHLATYYWWGIDDFGNDDCVTKKIFNEGNVKLRAYLIETIGRSLETLLPVIPGGPEALQRLVEMLNWRLSELEDSNIAIEQKSEEMKEFGWWFTYAQMDMKWLLDTLLKVLSITNGQIEWTHEVLKRLKDFNDIDTLKVAKATDLIVRADPAPWNIEYWQEHLCNIFESIKHSNNKDAWEVCKTTINFLGERGYRLYGKYLKDE